MRRFLLLLLIAGTAAADPPVYELPRDPKATVLSIGYRGPYIHPRLNGKPWVSILADGTVVAEHVGAGAKIGADELQDLLRFVIAKHKLLGFDRKAVEKKARRDIYITDQADTIVEIAIKGQRHTVVYNASTWAAQHNPKVRELQSLEAVRRRLHSLWCLTQLGEAKAKELLALANRALKKKHPKAAPLTLEDLERVDHGKDASRRVLFSHATPKGTTGAYVNLPKQGKPTAEVFVQPA